MLFQQVADSDLHSDIVIDVCLTIPKLYESFKHKDYPGYIQEFGVHPVRVVMYSHLQMKVMHTMFKYAPVSFLIDATGEFSWQIENSIKFPD